MKTLWCNPYHKRYLQNQKKKKSSLDIGVQDMKVKNGKVEGQFVPVWPKASLLHDDVRRGYSVV